MTQRLDLLGHDDQRYRLATRSLPRPETMVLFGCWLSDYRREPPQQSTADLATRVGRSAEWVGSVEAGVCLPTPTAFEQLRKTMAEDAAPSEPQPDPVAIAQELELDPWGPRARQLRRRHDVSTVPQRADQPDSPSLLVLFSEIHHRDRLLTVPPFLMVGFLAAVLLVGRPWSGQLGFGLPDFDAVTFLGLAAVFGLALEVPLLSRTLDAIVESTRRGESRTWYQRTAALRRREQVPLVYEHGWYRPAETPYLIPALAGRVRNVTIEIDLIERRLVVLVLGIVALLSSTAVSVLEHREPRFAHAVWLGATAVFVSIVVRDRWRLNRRAQSALGALIDGYGTPVVPVVEVSLSSSASPTEPPVEGSALDPA